MNNIYKYSLSFILFVFLQITVFNNIIVFSNISINFYILFIIWLPFKTQRWLMLLLGFLIGIIMDSVFNTGGVHLCSTVLIAYLRPFIIQMFISKYDAEFSYSPCIKTMGFRSYILYLSFLLLIHSFSTYYLELFHLKSFFFHLFYVLLNTITILLIGLLTELIIKKEK